MPTPRTVVIFGASGTGKSFLCASFVNRYPEYVHINAGKLLAISDRDMASRRTKVETLKEQRQFAAKFSKIRNTDTRRIILDAHSVLRSREGLLVIPIDIIKVVNPHSIVYVETRPELALARLHSRGEFLDLNMLDIEQEIKLSKIACHSYAQELSVRIYQIDGEDHKLIDKLMFAAFD